MEPMFDHERLEVYRMGRQFNRGVCDLLVELPRGQSESKDNLQRAAKSITRNLAEGSGKWKIADKANFYQISRASSTECAASLDELVDYRLVKEERVRPLKEILSRIIAMLIGLIQSIENRSDKDSRR